MKKLLLTPILFVLAVLSAFAESVGDVEVARQLAERVIPGYAGKIDFKVIPPKGGNDVYSIESAGDKIVISGNNANSMAVGLNTYLKRYCHTTVSWYAEVPVEMPDMLPPVAVKEEAVSKVERRFFLNYCTYGYTMPFWNWAQWERIIDWMALNGVNMPLAITGQEAVWYNVWKKLGMSDEEIRGYFTGPTYLPWHRMANIDKWNGPLPKEWLEKQTELQGRILKRERELNMKPVLPAFAGHVPGKLKEIYPDANIKYLGQWAGFDDAYRCYFLNPEEPLFAKIQELFLEEQTRLFGTDHIYGVDPFNEVDPPSWEPEYLKAVSRNMYKTLAKVDPKAEWMQMSWMFYHDRKLWTAPRIKALLTGVKKGQMSLLDYHCENVELWKTTDKFYGQPYIWCYLGNFGGNTTITGNVKESGARLDVALHEGGKNLLGIGSTLEGLDVVQFPYEYIFEKAWTNSLSDDEWVENLADRHMGEESAAVREAWRILFNDVYVQVPRTLGTLLQLRPKFGDSYTKRTSVNYDKEQLVEAWKLLLDAPSANRDAMRLDIITTGRQVLGNLFLDVKTDFDSAYNHHDMQGLQRNATLMRELLKDIDALNAHHHRCGVKAWIDDARSYGSGEAIKNYYELNARNLVTTWGGKLNDYANRSWAGLISDYYAKRWDAYIDIVTEAAKSGKNIDEKALENKMKEIESAWVESTVPVGEQQVGDVLTFSRLLCNKYESLF